MSFLETGRHVMQGLSKTFGALLTIGCLFGVGASALAQPLTEVQLNMAFYGPEQKMYLTVSSSGPFEGYFVAHPETLVVPGYNSSIVITEEMVANGQPALLNFELEDPDGIPVGTSIVFHCDIWEYNPLSDEFQLRGPVEDELTVVGRNGWDYDWDCDPYVPDEVSTDPMFDFCMWLCHRTYVIPIVCHQPLQGVPLFRIRPGCDEDLEIDPEHEYSTCSWDTCSNDADETVLSWHVVITDTANCNAFLVIIYCDAAPGCACLKAPDWILPVDLTAFNAFAGNGYVDIRWTTATETDNDHFDIWRRVEGQTWTRIAQDIEGHGTTSEPHSYSYRDASVTPGVAYEYRLESVDINGQRHQYDNIAAATPYSAEVPAAYDLRQNYPNPFNASTSFEFTLREGGWMSLKIHDLLGREVATVVEGNLEARRHQVTWSADGLPSGIYLYTLNAGEFTQTRKMLLLK